MRNEIRTFPPGVTLDAIDRNNGSLKWDVFTSKRPGLSRDLPPGKEELMWVANSSTLIYGERDAVLVDTFLTIDQSQALQNWVVASGKNLIAIYLTHGHGDHVFGVGSLLERFPHAKAVATPEVVAAMREQVSPTSLENFWRKLFPGQIAEHLPVADPLPDNELELEGHKLIAVNTGRTDTAQSTCLHVPSVGLLVGGDVVYNGFIPILPRPPRRAGANGSPRSIDSRRSTRELSSLGTRFRKIETSRASSRKRGSIFAISIAWMKPPPPSANSMTRCWNSILIARIQALYGAAPRLRKRAPSYRFQVRRKRQSQRDACGFARSRLAVSSA